MKHLSRKIAAAVCFLCTLLCFSTACGQVDSYDLTETTFFRVMSNMLFYPEQYLEKEVSLDCFVYEIEDAETGEKFTCGVRKCSSGYGCTCGNDTIIGFILEYGGDIPAARNQSADTSDKTWIHISGQLVDAEKRYVSVYSYQNGKPTDTLEKIYFYGFAVSSLTEIDGSGLAYYVTK